MMFEKHLFICSKLTLETLEQCVESTQKQKINKETRKR